MDKRLFQIGSVILGAILMGSCARGIVAPPGLSSKLLDIKVDNTDTATVITLKTNNLPQYASFTTKSPPAITVDLASTDASNVSGSMSVDNGFVKKISVNQLGESTGYSSRIIITLEKPLAYQTSADGNNIIINVSKSEEQKTVLPSEGLQLTTPTPSVGAEMSPSVSPEALAPIGMEASPTTLPLTPPAGAEMSPSVSPEALAPIGMEASPTTLPLTPP
ncbi:MAG: AMIN domain-containing protein, partial [bacterium]